jgi:hypothetical protein
MEVIETEWMGVHLKGEILYRTAWDYSVRLIEPVHSWSTGSYIPTFARNGRLEKDDNFLGKYGESLMKMDLINLYQKGEIFYGKLPGLKDEYQKLTEQLVELEKLSHNIREQIGEHLRNQFMDNIFGARGWNWTMDDRKGVFQVLENEWK